MICFLGGNRRAVAKLQELGRELGFGSTSEKDITYCGKRIRQWDDGHITITMEEYHSNLKTVNIPVPRRANPDSDLTEMERRQLRAILGSLQWLVAQLRFDLGFQLSTLQGEPPKISTLMKANLLVKRFKQDPDFALTFKPMDLKGAGIMVVTDASLGNVTKAGGADGTVLEKVLPKRLLRPPSRQGPFGWTRRKLLSAGRKKPQTSSSMPLYIRSRAAGNGRSI